MTTFAPSRARRRQMASPMPDAPPVTIATCPSNLFMAMLLWRDTSMLDRIRQSYLDRDQSRSVAQHAARIDQLHALQLAQQAVEPRLVRGTDDAQHPRSGPLAEGRADIGDHAQEIGRAHVRTPVT